MRKCKYDWTEIQDFYDREGSWRSIKEKFGCSNRTIQKSVEKGRLVLRNKTDAGLIRAKRGLKGHKHTEVTKKLISEKRIKFLTENPDKVPYLINHSSKKSYPEIIFENALNSSDISGWTYNYQSGMYSYDFAFPDLKIDVEIDGGTHLSEKVIKIDQRRDEYSKSIGWTVLRFTAKEVKENVLECIKRLQEVISRSS